MERERKLDAHGRKGISKRGRGKEGQAAAEMYPADPQFPVIGTLG